MTPLLSAFVDQLEGVLDRLNFQDFNCEGCFSTAVSHHVTGVRILSQPKSADRKIGFFGFRPKCADLVYEQQGTQEGVQNRLLIESKLLRKDNVYDIRNGLLQLIEYMKLAGPDDIDKCGCLLVLDRRDAPASFENELNRWLIDNLAHLYKNIAVIHIMPKDNSWGYEIIEPTSRVANQ